MDKYYPAFYLAIIMIINVCDQVTYVLRLEGDHYYVGLTTQLHNRLSKHFSGAGSAWTQLHPPVEVVSIVAFDREEEITIRAIKAFGIEKVRGHYLTTCNLSHRFRRLKKCFEMLPSTNLPKTWNVLYDRTLSQI